MTEPTPAESPAELPVCPRHPDQVSYVRCQRCHRPTCPACQRPAAVGVQCVDCVAEGARTVRQGRTVFGGTVTDGRAQLTLGIIGVTVAVFLVQQVRPEIVRHLAFWPPLAATEPWRFFTSALVHANIMHIAFNLYALYLVGQFLEPALGRARFAALYLIGALGGSTAILLLASPSNDSWLTVTVGASGAVFALFGALVVMQRRIGISNNGIYVLLGINAIIPFVIGGISWQGHLGGFITGLAVGAVFAYIGRSNDPGRPGDFSRHWIGLGAIALILVGLAGLKLTLV